MKRRKTVALALAAAVALAALPAGVQAETVKPQAGVPAEAGKGAGEAAGAANRANKSRDEAVSLARRLLQIPEEYALQSASLSTELTVAGGRSVWNLTFGKKKGGKTEGTVYVGIDAARRQLVQYSVYVNDPADLPDYPPKVDREEAAELALRFIRQVAPDYAGQVRPDPDYGVSFRPPLTGEVRHHFRFNRIVHGVPYKDNFVQMEMDGEGRVLSYRLTWDHALSFPEATPGISLEEATKRFREQAELELAYLFPYDSTERKPQLGYLLNPFLLDAVTGERWSAEAGAPANRTVPVAERPLAAAPQGNRNLTSEEAAAVVDRLFPLPDGVRLTDTRFSESGLDGEDGTARSVWRLEWSSQENGRQERHISASVDSRTGVVLDYYAYGNEDKAADPNGQPVGYDAARRTALDAIRSLLPHLAHELYLQEPDQTKYEGKTAGEIGSYSFTFQHRVNGALVEYDHVQVAVSALTGDIQYYSADLADFAYPAEAPAVIGRDRALDIWMDACRVELMYVSPFVWDGVPLPREKYYVLLAAGEIRPDEAANVPQPKLVYALTRKPTESELYVDAQTGKWIDRATGKETAPVRMKPVDIEGHWAARELELMAAYGALDLQDGKVRPNEIITRAELIKMLVIALNSGRPIVPYAEKVKAAFQDVSADSSYFVYVQSALAQNLIDRGDGSFRPEGKVTREEMAELIVRALGYNTLAKRDDLFRITFADADATGNKGQIAIAVGLGIMSLNKDGKFEPAREVTRAEAAAAFFRFLRVRAELQEAPLRE